MNEPENKPRKVKVKGMGGVYERGGFWYVRYTYRGETLRESSGSRLKSVARDLLKKRISEIQHGAFIPAARRTKLSDLLAMTERDYRSSGQRSLGRLIGSEGESGLHGHLTRLLGADTPVDRVGERIEKYKETRLEEGAAPGTINRELSALRRAFKLGLTSKPRRASADDMPAFHFLEEPPPRKGFPEPEEVERIIAAIDDRLKGVVRFLSITGWRLGEALNLQWANVDTKEGTIKLYSDETKGGEARVYHYAEDPELKALIADRKAVTAAWDLEHSSITPWVFWHRTGGGEPRPNGLTWSSAAFRKAAQRAKCGHIRAHDLRRYVARNLIRVGVHEKLAMELLGHRTTSIFRRYNVVDERDRKAAIKLYAENRARAATANEA